MTDPYCYPNSRILKNKFNIKDYDELLEAERRLTKYRMEELFNNPIPGHFNFKHLQKIHAYLFQDLYDWAGEVRTVDIGEMVMARLKDLDEVAYVRFASVYRSFKDINTFMDELSKLLTEQK